MGSGTVDEAAKKIQIAEHERILKKIDTDGDNVITSAELRGAEGYGPRSDLSNAIMGLKELRGEEIPTYGAMRQGGQSITINNIDNSNNSQQSVPGSSDKKNLQGSGMSATDLRYEKKYMSMRGFGVAIGQVH